MKRKQTEIISDQPDKFVDALTFLLSRKALIQETADQCAEESTKYKQIVEELRDLQLENKKLKKELALLKKRIGAK